MPDDNPAVEAMQPSDDNSEHETGEKTGENEDAMQQSRELTPPPLPPRPRLEVPSNRPPVSGSMRLSQRASRPQLLSQATTALSLADVHTQSRGGEISSTQTSPASRAVSRRPSASHLGRLLSTSDSGGEDSTSLKSYAPTLDARLDGESLMGDLPHVEATTPAWRALSAQVEHDNPFDKVPPETDFATLRIQHEFDEIALVDSEATNEEALLGVWKAKLKHFFILSASGKPIYSRHGDDQLISNYIGVAQTLISFYQGAGDPLRGFTAGGARFVMLSKGPLNLVAVSRLGESDAQLRTQLESLYMQILSTLTLPSMERMFSNRPSTDLRRPLQGTDVLLDGLADGFTRGSPSTLLSALECLRLRKTHRRAINDTLLKVRSPNLLYGLIVAAGRLVSVVRPKKHSLHPGDLHLIFNMLFEAGSVKAGGGENWIPICLPGFNNTGYLYMYVSFFSTADAKTPGSPHPPSAQSTKSTTPDSSSNNRDDNLAIVLISAQKEGFFELRTMRDDLVSQLEKNGSMTLIKTAIRKGHSTCTDTLPGTALRHFLYKSRGNVQFTQPSFHPYYSSLGPRRKLMNLYGSLHAAVHNTRAGAGVKVLHCVVAGEATALAWETPVFELYCVAGPGATRGELARGAERVVQWIRREEERVFIIGGAVF